MASEPQAGVSDDDPCLRCGHARVSHAPSGACAESVPDCGGVGCVRWCECHEFKEFDMSDLIEREAAIAAVNGVADFNRDVVDALRALPSASAPAERLARAVVEEEEALDAARVYPTPPGAMARLDASWKKKAEALAAFRAAPEPAPKAEPAKPDPCVCGRCPGLEGPPEEPAKHEHREDTLTTVGDRYGAPCGKCKRGAVNVSDGKCRACGSQEQKPCPSCRPGGVA